MGNLLHLKLQDNKNVRSPQHLKIRLGIQNQGSVLLLDKQFLIQLILKVWLMVVKSKALRPPSL